MNETPQMILDHKYPWDFKRFLALEGYFAEYEDLMLAHQYYWVDKMGVHKDADYERFKTIKHHDGTKLYDWYVLLLEAVKDVELEFESEEHFSAEIEAEWSDANRKRLKEMCEREPDQHKIAELTMTVDDLGEAMKQQIEREATAKRNLAKAKAKLDSMQRKLKAQQDTQERITLETMSQLIHVIAEGGEEEDVRNRAIELLQAKQAEMQESEDVKLDETPEPDFEIVMVPEMKQVAVEYTEAEDSNALKIGFSKEFTEKEFKELDKQYASMAVDVLHLASPQHLEVSCDVIVSKADGGKYDVRLSTHWFTADSQTHTINKNELHPLLSLLTNKHVRSMTVVQTAMNPDAWYAPLVGKPLFVYVDALDRPNTVLSNKRLWTIDLQATDKPFVQLHRRKTKYEQQPTGAMVEKRIEKKSPETADQTANRHGAGVRGVQSTVGAGATGASNRNQVPQPVPQQVNQEEELPAEFVAQFLNHLNRIPNLNGGGVPPVSSN